MSVHVAKFHYFVIVKVLPDYDLNLAIDFVQIVVFGFKEVFDLSDEGRVVLLFEVGLAVAGGFGGECEEVATFAMVAALLVHSNIIVVLCYKAINIK